MVKNPPLFMTIRRLFAGGIFTLGSNTDYDETGHYWEETPSL
jgi:hypothetical protein